MAFVLKSRIYARSNDAGFVRNSRELSFSIFFLRAAVHTLRLKMRPLFKIPLENITLSFDLSQRDDDVTSLRCSFFLTNAASILTRYSTARHSRTLLSSPRIFGSKGCSPALARGNSSHQCIPTLIRGCVCKHAHNSRKSTECAREYVPNGCGITNRN